jgi:hypothetical protein
MKRALPFLRLAIAVIALSFAATGRADYTTCYDTCAGNYYGCKSFCSWWNIFCSDSCMSEYQYCLHCCDGNCGEGSGFVDDNLQHPV